MVHRDDLADLYVRAAESGLGGEVLNATDRSRATVLECAAAASLAAGAEGRVEHVPGGAGRRRDGPLRHLPRAQPARRLLEGGPPPRLDAAARRLRRRRAPRLYAAWKAASAGVA